MGHYPNQKLIVIHRENVEKAKEKERPFLVAYHDNLIAAMNGLTAAEFKVYICLLFNKDKFQLGFSPEHIQDIANVGKDTIRKALNSLERIGLLEFDGNSKYHFYESNNVEREHKKKNYNFFF